VSKNRQELKEWFEKLSKSEVFESAAASFIEIYAKKSEKPTVEMIASYFFAAGAANADIFSSGFPGADNE